MTIKMIIKYYANGRSLQ